MVTINSEYLGKLNTRSRHEPSKTTLNTAAPVDNQGDGSSFSPTDLLATATLNCMLTIMGISANNNHFSVDGANGSVKKHMGTNPRRVNQLEIQIHVPTQLTEDQRRKTLQAAQNCPVMKSIHPDIEVNLNMTFAD